VVTQMVYTVPAKVPRIAVYISEEVKQDLERLASFERRSLSQMAAILIEEGIDRAKQQGKITPTEESDPNIKDE
jgi:predicted transcriptional regulator